MMALVFPGQGSQKVGMGKELAEAFPVARHVFEEIDEALKQNLSRLMFEGPESDLILTENAQPAIMAVSLAVMEVLKKEGGKAMPDLASYVAGHSLGEYSALAAADALTITDTARLLQIRGQAMQRAVPVGEGGMAALLGLDFEQAQKVAEEAAESDVCVAANDNAPGQVVVSGGMLAVDRAVEIAKTHGARRAVKLAVSAPFHSPMMEPAAEVMRAALAEVDLRSPVVPLVANVTAKAVSEPDAIRDLLVQQVTGMVRWRESMLYLKEQGVTQLIELGAGNVLSGLARRIDRELAATSIETPQQIEDFLKV